MTQHTAASYTHIHTLCFHHYLIPHTIHHHPSKNDPSTSISSHLIPISSSHPISIYLIIHLIPSHPSHLSIGISSYIIYHISTAPYLHISFIIQSRISRVSRFRDFVIALALRNSKPSERLERERERDFGIFKLNWINTCTHITRFRNKI